MTKGTKINKEVAEVLFLLAVIVTIGFILACAEPLYEQQHKQQSGMSGLTGWNGWDTWYDSANQIRVAAGMDINGEVGHPLFVGGCRTNCEPGGNWTANHRVIKGTFPPGIDFTSNSSAIEGIPRERGHWIVQVEIYDVICNGVHYVNVRQELRFHITGTGTVH